MRKLSTKCGLNTCSRLLHTWVLFLRETFFRIIFRSFNLKGRGYTFFHAFFVFCFAFKVFRHSEKFNITTKPYKYVINLLQFWLYTTENNYYNLSLQQQCSMWNDQKFANLALDSWILLVTETCDLHSLRSLLSRNFKIKTCGCIFRSSANQTQSSR